MFGGINLSEFKDINIAQKYVTYPFKSNQKLFQEDKFWCFYNPKNERLISDINDELYAITQGSIRILGGSVREESTILDLYRFHGPDFLMYLGGIFSLVLWDSKKKILILATDLFGIKPLYYYAKGRGSLLFSTSIKPLIHCIHPRLNDKIVQQFMVFGFVPQNECIVADIHEISNSSCVICEGGSLAIHKYYSIKINQKNRPFEYYKRKIATTFFKIVEDYSKHSGQISVAFSGGLDSSIILSLLSKLDKKVTTFTAVIEGKHDDRATYVKETARFYGSDHREITINEDRIAQSFADSTRFMNQPVCDTDAPTISILAKSLKNTPLVFFGKGADELYCSCGHYVPKSKNVKAFTSFSKTISNNFLFALPYLIRAKKIDDNSLVFNDLLKCNLKFFKSLSRYGVYALNSQFFDLACSMSRETSTPNAIYTNNNVNYNYPFLDKEFVDLSLRIPLSYKKKENLDKYILRKAFSNILIERIYKTPKGSTAIPQHWITDNIDYEKVLHTSEILRKYFKKEYLNKIKNYSNSKELISLLILDLWYENFLAIGGRENE